MHVSDLRGRSPFPGATSAASLGPCEQDPEPANASQSEACDPGPAHQDAAVLSTGPEPTPQLVLVISY